MNTPEYPMETGPGNPEVESMSNFHCHMPGGIYRVYEKHPEDSLAHYMQNTFKIYEGILDDDESTWPAEKASLIRIAKTKRDIQRRIDEILETDQSIKDRWETLKGRFKNGGERPEREYVLRPIYVQLRESFSERDLSS